MNSNKAIFVIGVSGVGKSTIGMLLSEDLGIPFFDGDDFHPKENIRKMASGTPLNDEDRLGWLTSLNQLAKEQLKHNSCIIACSALKHKYRVILSNGIENKVKWVHLHGTFDQISKRIKNRTGHFMPPDLLKSQFIILENPNECIQVDISLNPKQIVKKVKEELLHKSEFGLVGLGVMGKSLSRNLARNGFKISMYNRHVNDTEEDVAINFKNEYDELKGSGAFDQIPEFVNSLQKPRKIMLMVNAGKVVDFVIDELIPFLSEGDIIIDGGNSNYKNTKERYEYLKSKKLHFIGAGVSGGEEGALKGPSIMPGGNKEVYDMISPFLKTISAKDDGHLPCCAYVGPDGSGHYVKMVHNGIEYVEMQLLAEVFDILKSIGKNLDEIADIFESWKNKANSYLLEITIDILRKKEGNDWLVNKILDKAGNKGTGNWATIASAQLGIPSTLIASALFARYISFYKEERILQHKRFNYKKDHKLSLNIEEVLKAYQFSRIINHHQGFKLIVDASKTYAWNLNLSEIARIWTGGCIIKSAIMKELVQLFKKSDDIFDDKEFVQSVKKIRPAANKVVSECILYDLAIPCLSESVNFFNAYTTDNSSASLIQAQRDYFGAHTYQRNDDKSNRFYHTDWTKK